MGRWRGNVIFINRNPHEPEAGWGWIEIKTEDLKRFNIPNSTPAPRRVTKTQLLSVIRYGECGSYEEPFI